MSLTIELTPAEESAIRAAAIDDDLVFVRSDSISAARAAQQNLLDRGIGYVVARNDGTIVRRFTDGSEIILFAVVKM